MEKIGSRKSASRDATKEEYLPMDQTATTQAGHSSHSDHNGEVFFSYSCKHKDFVRLLHKELTKLGVSCFDTKSLALAEDFSHIIVEAAEMCKLAVLVISRDSLESKWPMLELSTCVKVRDRTLTNPNLKILPLFFLISPDALKNSEEYNEKWKQLKLTGEQQAECHQALKAIRRTNGIIFRQGDDEVEFREEIAKEIWRILPPAQRYYIPRMQGEERMCQELTKLFDGVRPNEKGISIAGLYGIAGDGKTSLGKALCNLKLSDFEGKVCHLEFSRGGREDLFERRKLALQYLTNCPQYQVEVDLNERLKSERVLLVLDNIETDEDIREVRYYLQAVGKNSWILLIARSLDVLLKNFNMNSESCMGVPNLTEEEAIAILLGIISPEVSTLGAEEKAIALKCVNRCSFSCNIVREVRTYHPLALKAVGHHLCKAYGLNLSKWPSEIDGLADRSRYGLDDVFSVLGKAFDDMREKYCTIFMLLTIYMLPNMSRHKVIEWLAIICNEEIWFINKAVEDLCEKSFIEEFETEIRIHGLFIEFSQSRAKEMKKWLWWKGDSPSTRGLISQDIQGFKLARLEQCKYRLPSQIPPNHLKNLLVLQLVGVQNMTKFDCSRMYSLRSITLQNCEDMIALEGIENLVLAWLQISNVNPKFELPKLSGLHGLQHLEIDIADTQQLGDLTAFYFLREINVRCPSLSAFPRLDGLPYLERVEFSSCGEVKGPLDCTDCAMLQSVVLKGCCKMAAPPILAGCRKLNKFVWSECGGDKD